MLRTKSVYSAIEKKRDGLRILCTRVRGRGLPSSRYDVWMANLGPSERLLDLVRTGRIPWREFTRLYRNELFSAAAVDRQNVNIKNHGQKFTLRLLRQLAAKGNVTLMCHCDEDQDRCHRHVLRKMIARA